MRLARFAEPFDHPDFLYELKYDGFRALAVVDGAVRLVSRRKHHYKAFQSVERELLAATGKRSVVLDGEIVALNERGEPQFYDLLRRRGDAHFIAFDILHLDGRDLRDVPLWKRKALLRAILPEGGPVLYARHIEGNGAKLFEQVRALDLEGIVAKWKEGTYLDGSTLRTSWMKIKNPAYSQMVGRDELFKKRARA